MSWSPLEGAGQHHIHTMLLDQADAADTMRQRLQADLRLAIKGRVALDIVVLRGLIAAIDNAGAVPLSPRGAPRQCEVERRRLGLSDIHAILSREYEARRSAASEFTRLGLVTACEQASQEMGIIGRYLNVPR